jgi:ribonuclease Y
MLVISIVGLLMLVAGAAVLAYSVWQHRNSEKALSETKRQLGELKHKIEAEQREASLKIKDELYNKRRELEDDMRKERVENDKIHKKINDKFDELAKREQRLEDFRYELQHKERDLSRRQDALHASETKIKSLYADLIAKLEQTSRMTCDEAKKTLLEILESEVQLANNKWIAKVEDEARHTAKEKSTQLLVTAMQRYVSDLVTPHTAGVVQLPNDDMKGRIIGKEGRNIKALEMATGMEFVIGDTPEIITISGFNPIRREVAHRALERLIADGRINPTRIEETVAQCEREIEEAIAEYGKDTILEFNLQGVHPEIVELLGKLHFRTSYSQNVLIHCKEVGIFARMLAEELGLDPQIALRAGLLHDIGKAVTAEIEGPHAIIGAEIAKRCGEDPRVINAIAAHHEEVPFTSVYGALVVIADTISASRPGARRETYSAYIKRLEKLEEIGNSFEGVKKVYALQAGRELRILVEEDHLDDDRSRILARDIAARVEQEMNFPGQIKINVIREKRSIEYAK